MKKSLLLVAAAVTALFTACSSDELAYGNDVVNVSLNASFDQVMPTRGVSGESDGRAGFTLTYAPSVTFSGDWAGTDGKDIDRY